MFFKKTTPDLFTEDDYVYTRPEDEASDDFDRILPWWEADAEQARMSEFQDEVHETMQRLSSVLEGTPKDVAATACEWLARDISA
jgi:hypothetical protein